MPCEIAVGHPSYHPLYLASLSLAQALREKLFAVAACAWS